MVLHIITAIILGTENMRRLLHSYCSFTYLNSCTHSRTLGSHCCIHSPCTLSVCTRDHSPVPVDLSGDSGEAPRHGEYVRRRDGGSWVLDENPRVESMDLVLQSDRT